MEPCSISQYRNVIEKITEAKKFHHLPRDISISTMTIICRFDLTFNVINIAQLITQRNSKTISIYKSKKKIKQQPITNHVIEKHQLKTNNDNKKKEFYNQISIKILVNDETKKEINVKLFKNGSIQMTGCQSIKQYIQTIDIICKELLNNVYYISPNNIVLLKTVSNRKELTVENIKDTKITLINSGCYLHNFKIDRTRLYKLLIAMNIPYNFDYEPSRHAGVILKYFYERTISVYIFESGYLMITGAMNVTQLAKAYYYICSILYNNYSSIVQRNTLNTIKQLLKKERKEQQQNL